MVPDINKTTATAGTSGANRTLDDASKKKLQKAVNDFEAMFVNYLLQNLRNTIPQSEEEGSGFGKDVMQGMFDMEISKQIAGNSSFGIAEMLYKQMTGEPLPRHAAASARVSGSGTPGNGVPIEPSARTQSGLHNRIEQYSDSIKNASASYDMDPNLIKAVIAAESGGNARALSSKNAKGLMQLIDSTASDMGVSNVWDPNENIQGGTKYLKGLLDQFDGDTKLALASYNAGPDSVKRYGGIPPFAETQQYVQRVMGFLNAFRQQEVASNAKN